MTVKWKLYDDRFVTVNGVRTRYWETGGGDRHLLFLHGFGGAVEEWVFNIPEFESRYHVIALDFPGQGLSDKPDIPYTAEFFAEFIAQFLRSLGIERAAVVAHSLGGMIALMLSIKYPGLVSRMVLLAPACIRHYGLMHRLPTVPVLGEYLMKPPSSLQAVRNTFRYLTFNGFDMPDEVVRQAFGVYSDRLYIRASLNYLRTHLNLFGLTRAGKELIDYFEKNLAGIKIPVALFWGREDRVLPIRHNAFIRKNLADARYHEVENCGHNPHWEYAQMINAYILDFLK